MITKKDRQLLIQDMKEVFVTKDDLKQFATKDDLKAMENRIVKDVTDYLHDHIILELSRHDRRLDRLEKTVGGFPPLAD